MSVFSGAAALRASGRGFGGALQRVGLTVIGGVSLVVMVAAWFGARALGSRTMFLMVYGAILAVLMAYIVSRRRLKLRATRSRIATRLRVGQPVDVVLQLEAARRASTLLLQEVLHPRLGDSVTIPVPALRPGEELEYAYSFRPTLRGIYRVGPLTATWSDPFGLTTHRQNVLPSQEVIVHPATESVFDRVLTRMWEDPPIRPPQSKPWPVGFELYGMRDYVPGDDIRRVVWSVVAKTGRLMVRESEQGITDRVVLLLDNHRSEHTPGEISDSFELAVRVAASVGVRHLKDGFSVTVLTNDGPIASALRGTRADIQLLDQLARVDRGDKRMSHIGERLLAEGRSRAHFLVITPHLDKDAAARLRLLLERGLSVVVAHVVHDESDPLSTQRAAAVGAKVLEVPLRAPLAAAFARLAGRSRLN